ncbi:RNA polymerase sigma factor [Bacteroides sp. OttesenSCG-928-M17]|nr:RNA polymerase sigma factor [Bacteroides sp. OttesenSCG-928-M17]
MNKREEYLYVQRILDGETELFSILLERHSRPVYSLVIQIVSSPEDAEELVQDIFLKAFRSLSGYKGDASFSTWIYRIAYNMAISFTRKRRPEYLYIEESTINNVPDSDVENLLFASANEERIAGLTRAIDQLHAEEKAIITLFYYEEKSIEEIAVILAITVSNVKVKLHRTRKKIYVLMSKEESV